MLRSCAVSCTHLTTNRNQEKEVLFFLPTEMIKKSGRPWRHAPGYSRPWEISRRAMLFLKGASAATFASTAVAAACSWQEKSTPQDNDAIIVTIPKITGEPRSLIAPHSTMCAVSSNTKCEDRSIVHIAGKGENSESYFAVYDGHGGWECAEFAYNMLPDSISSFLPKEEGCKNDDEMESAISKGFCQVEERWTEKLKVEWLKNPNYVTYGPPGTERLSSVGTCVLLAVVHKGVLYIANAGDSRAVLAQKGFGGGYRAQRVTTDLNAMNPAEQDRLRRNHPGEVDIVRCRGLYSCYVKGCLQPTYSLGDAYLKYPHFNNFPGRVIPDPYKPPYIETIPEITARPLNNCSPGDFLILATDGVWDYLSDQNAVDLAQRAMTRGENAAAAIVEATLAMAASRFGINREQLSELPMGRQRRLIHDDATVIVVDLWSVSQNQEVGSSGEPPRSKL
uniref:PPM-type phosphatase domain-containing protein n=1 Tax=Guillardia theta TaxID=55529 RepID=A0A7S4PIH2_GUITH|mmetsp:Transcript_51424/g.160468  ORF Transcript_51424/g.160468 Transcript_51424/m.160468 type:complete len:450 (+) Transcript_51424:247-1596(+)